MPVGPDICHHGSVKAARSDLFGIPYEQSLAWSDLSQLPWSFALTQASTIAGESPRRFKVGCLAKRGDADDNSNMFLRPARRDFTWSQDLGSILAFDDFDGALEQDNKAKGFLLLIAQYRGVISLLNSGLSIGA